MTEAPQVDSHVHVWTKEMPLVSNPRHRPHYEFTVEQYLETLNAHDVQYGVIAAASIFGTYNDYTMAAVRAHKRLRGTVNLDPSTELTAMKEMKQAGIVGVRLPWISLAAIPAIDSVEYREFLRKIVALDWHVHLHVGRGRLAAVLPHLEACGVRIVIDHFGNPDPSLGLHSPDFQAVLRSIDTGRTWVKLSAGYRVERRMAKLYAQTLLRTAGPERLVWGSDAPFAGFEKQTSYAQTIADFIEWIPDPATRRRIAGDTALQLYFADGVPNCR